MDSAVVSRRTPFLQGSLQFRGGRIYRSGRSAVSKQQRRTLPRGRRECATARAAFGSKTAASNQVYICIDCGYIYDGRVAFNELGKDYRCPVCQAPKRRFKAQAKPSADRRRNSGVPASGAGVDKSDVPIFLAGGVGILVIAGAVLAYLNSQF